jgi:hypothetical protein
MWNDRLRQHCFADAQSVKHVERIGPKLNAVADDAELRCLFEQTNTETLARKRKRDGGPTEAAAHD